MINYYPSFNHLLREFTILGGNQCGIMQGFTVPVVSSPPDPYLKSITGRMPNYHKLILKNPTAEMQYHLSGYGMYYEEAMVKYMGESIERYSTVVSTHLAKDRIIYASYEDISKKNNAMPLEYLNIYTAEQQIQLSNLLPAIEPRHATNKDIIGWVKCYSLMNPGEEIWVPSQMIFVGFKKNAEKGEKMFVPSFSTGTASHRTIKEALFNALLEYIQIDAFIIKWYTKMPSKKVIIDDSTILHILKKIKLGDDSSYEVIPLYLTHDIEIPIFGVFLKRKDKKIPYILFGVQGDLDAYNALLRGTMESAAILSLGYYHALYDPQMYNMADYNSAYTDLDTNVLFYASPKNYEKKDNIINELIKDEINLSSLKTQGKTSDINTQIEYIIKELSKVSKYAVYLDMTPPEVSEMGWHVIRVFIPEICGMCLPGFPFGNHPRIKKLGGIKNEFPHPLP
ncbi:MAG: YcaO-like family protein [Thermoanaerobacteraceae bacterium]|nr:YcaO-like family protein [Thermoanaerobacteraceae bacterium]